MMTEVDQHVIEPTDDEFACSCGKTFPIMSKATRHAKEANARIARNKAAVDTEPDNAAASPLTLVAQAPEGPVAQAAPGPVAQASTDKAYSYKRRTVADGAHKAYDVFAAGSDEPLGVAARTTMPNAKGGTDDAWEITLTGSKKPLPAGKFRDQILTKHFGGES